MLFNTAALLLASILSVTAHPAVQQLDTRGDYTCGDAYNDCQGSGKGSYVCWADNKSKTCGAWGAHDMMNYRDKPLKNYCKGVAYCCKNDAVLDIDIDIDILGIIEIDIEIELEQQCQGRRIWSE